MALGRSNYWPFLIRASLPTRMPSGLEDRTERPDVWRNSSAGIQPPPLDIGREPKAVISTENRYRAISQDQQTLTSVGEFQSASAGNWLASSQTGIFQMVPAFDDIATRAEPAAHSGENFLLWLVGPMILSN